MSAPRRYDRRWTWLSLVLFVVAIVCFAVALVIDALAGDYGISFYMNLTAAVLILFAALMTALRLSRQT